MHLTAIENAKAFFETYLNASNNEACKVIEIGSKDINGSLRSVCPRTVEYVGLDFEIGAGVDIVLDDPYLLPFDNETCDIVISSSCFEHSEMFWVLFLEIMRVLKPLTSSHKPVSSEPENRAVWLNYKMTLQTSLVGDPPAMNAV